MVTGVFFGSADSGKLWSHGLGASDNGQAVLARVITNRFAPAGYDAEVVVLSVTVQMSANCSASFKLVPVVDDVRYDGGLAPDWSVAFSVVGDTRTAMPMSQDVTLGVSQAIPGGGTAGARLGLRGTWYQFEIVGTSAIGLDATGEIGVVFLNGIQVEYQVVRGTAQPTAPGTATTPWPKQPGYQNTTGGEMALTTTSDLKARNVKCRQEDNTSAALLETDINNFLKGLTEEVILDIQTHVYNATYVAFIFYTE